MAAAKYPRDRVVLNQIARILFLQREYAEALEALTAGLRWSIPKICRCTTRRCCRYRGLGNAESAEREQKLFERFKAEESAQAITGERRRLIKPEENNERQQIHEHESVPLGAPSRSETVVAPAACRRQTANACRARLWLPSTRQ